MDLVRTAFVKVEKSNKVCRLSSDYGASVLLSTVVYVFNKSVLNKSVPHNVSAKAAKN